MFATDRNGLQLSHFRSSFIFGLRAFAARRVPLLCRILCRADGSFKMGIRYLSITFIRDFLGMTQPRRANVGGIKIGKVGCP